MSAGIEESVEDLDHVGVFIHAVLVLEPLHDLIDAVFLLPEIVPEVLGHFSAELGILVKGDG